MPLVLFHTRRVRQALAAPTGLFPDMVFLLFCGAVFGLIMTMARQASLKMDLSQPTIISLSFLSLPKYTMLSLSRGFAAYILSLVFTLIYGTIAAHNRRAERVMIPALDVLQAIPVLGFLPGLVLAMIRFFPTRRDRAGNCLRGDDLYRAGLEHDLQFSWKPRGIPTPLREVAAIQRLSGWQTFRLLEVPASMIGLVWNSMMSMAGGWFFLTVNEAFTLGDKDYRLPGIGSYMNEAINQDNVPAMIAAIVAMIVMIVAVDQLFWRPIVVWAQRFRMDDIAQTDVSQSWMLDLLRRSRIYSRLQKLFARKHANQPRPSIPLQEPTNSKEIPPSPGPSVDDERAAVEKAETSKGRAGAIFLPLLKWFVMALLLLGAAWGTWRWSDYWSHCRSGIERRRTRESRSPSTKIGCRWRWRYWPRLSGRRPPWRSERHGRCRWESGSGFRPSGRAGYSRSFRWWPASRRRCSFRW